MNAQTLSSSPPSPPPAWTSPPLVERRLAEALNQPGLRIEDVSRLLGSSSVRVTQDVYIHVHDDLYERFYGGTE